MRKKREPCGHGQTVPSTGFQVGALSYREQHIRWEISAKLSSEKSGTPRRNVAQKKLARFDAQLVLHNLA
jgi:hypothetical protein